MRKFLIFLSIFAAYCKNFRNFALAIHKECKDILLNRLSIHHREKEQTHIIGTAPTRAQISPYICVACGEPRVVWRMSAPLL